MTCLACNILHDADPLMSPDLAFIAGIAFGMSHNNRACYAALCPVHKAIMLEGEARAAHAIAPQDER